MQRYLADKHEHLKKTSQQLADKQATDKTPASTARPSVSTASTSRPQSFVRSLEDLRSVDTGVQIIKRITNVIISSLNFRLSLLQP